MSAPLVVCEGVRKHFRARRALDGLDWRVEPGEIVGLLGRNGAGKSTLLRILVGHERADEGVARLFGEDCAALKPAARARLAYVAQHEFAFGEFSADELLRFVAAFYPRFDLERARARLRDWDVPGHQPQQQMSPGHRQKLAIIRALASSPELLLLDEPASALDPLARRQLLEEITAIARDQGTTVILATHWLSDVERVAGRVAFLHAGRVVRDPPLAEIRARWRVWRWRLDDPARELPTLPAIIGARRQGEALDLVVDTGVDTAALEKALGEPRERVDATLEDFFVILEAT